MIVNEVLLENTIKMLLTLREELTYQGEYDGYLDEDLAEIIHLLNGGTNG